MDHTIESQRPGDEERRHDLGRQAFGGTGAFDPETPQHDADRVVAAYAGDEMVGAVVTHGFEMTWGGRRVPCGGVAGVVVAPEARGHGMAKAGLRESFDRMVRRGEVISALFPTTTSLYRSMGYEIAGSFERRRVPLAVVPTAPAEGLSWRRVEPGDPILFELHTAMAAQHDGWFRPDPTWWAFIMHRWRRDTSTNRFVYVGRRGGTDVVAVAYHYIDSEALLYEIDVDVCAGVDHEAVAAGLAFVASHATTASELRTTLPRHLLATLIPHVQRTRHQDDWPWMLRLVDAPGAIAARGWPVGVRGRVDLDIVDDVRQANAGPHVLELDGGEARLVRGGTGAVTVTIQDLAAVYAGADPRHRHAAGGLGGANAEALDLLAAATAGTATTPIFF